jgi:N-acetylmuramoyl-L-alanine amidase
MKQLLILISVIKLGSLHAQSPGTILLGKTTGPLPFLEYGLGEDRLGGAKMTYIDSNVVVNIIDSVKDKYKVRLSKYHEAWLPKNAFAKDTVDHFRPYYLTGSWKVYGDSSYDYVTVSLDDRLPYASVQEINPARIVVDVFGATSNTNWITQLSTAKEIKNAYYRQVEDDVFRIFIELKHQQHWGYFIYYNNHSLVIRVKRPPSKLTPQSLLVAIDAGHGGDNTGASGVTSNVLEKNYTLKIAKEVQQYFNKKKVKTFMTRVTDTSLSMVERTSMLRQVDPSILISIHLNSAGKDSIQGVSTYYRYIGFRPLSQAILKRMQEIKLKEWGNVGNFNFSLSGPTEYPNCLVEVAFLSNREDEKKILDPRFHKLVAQKIYQGVEDWLKTLK